MKRLLLALLLLALASPAWAGWGSVPEYSPPWVDKTESDGIVYLLYAFPFKIERYDLTSRTWLSTINLDSSPRSLALIPNGFVVAFGTKVSRFDLDGNNEQVLLNAWPDPTDIAADDGYLFVFKNQSIQSLRLSDGAQVDVASFSFFTPAEVALASESNRFFGWGAVVGATGILSVGYDPSTGLIDDSAPHSPDHGAYPRGERLFVEPSGQRPLDRAGIAYRAADLTHLSGLGGYIRDAAFTTSSVLLSRDDGVVLLDSDLREIGVAGGTDEVHGVAFDGADAVLFGGMDGKTVSVRPLASFAPPPVAVASSAHAAYQPTTVEMSIFGTIHLFDPVNSSVHRFDVNSWSYLPSISLPPQTDFVSLDSQNERLYVAQTGGRLSVVPHGAQRDSFLAHTLPFTFSVGAMDGHLMTADPAWGETHRVFDGLTGTETDSDSGNFGSLQYTWNRSLRRMFFFRDDTSPNDLHHEIISTTGQITGMGETPLHGTVEAVYPIRLEPSGAYALLGSGQIFDGTSLDFLGTTGETMTDASWIGTSLYTLRPSPTPSRSELVRWSSDFAPLIRGTIPGVPHALFSHNGQLIAVTRVNGFVRFLRYPATLSGTNVSCALIVSDPSAQAGAALDWSGTVINEGMETIAVSTTLSFNAEPADLTLLCELDGNPVDCFVSTPNIQTLDSGSVLTIQAWGSMPVGAETLVATLTASAADSRPEDNEVSVSVELDARLFVDGFEGP